MFPPTLALICFVLDYLIVAIIFNWRQYSLRKLWNVQFIIIAIINTIIAHFSFDIIMGVVDSISWTEGLTPDGRSNIVFPLAKYYYLDWDTPHPVVNIFTLSLTYIIIGSNLLYFPNKFISKVTSKWKCALITILLTIIPILIIKLYVYYYLHWAKT
jgi:hypothetical protein